MENTLDFAHRHNSDGTVDSICFLCFITIATSNFEIDLERVERNHVCDPDRAEHFRSVNHTSSKI